jgi:hypothetical protein
VHSSLVSYLLLIDTTNALHFQTVPTFSTTELFIRMPNSNHHFRTVFNGMMHGLELPADVRSCEDALLLLVALLSDIIYMQHCHQVLHREDTRANPFLPLTVQGECDRLTADMSAALSRWEHHFKQDVGKDILALSYFAHLRLACLGLDELTHEVMSKSGTARSIDISDRALDLAWIILEHCHDLPESDTMAIWLPIILFQSALVVWQRLRSPSAARKYGTLSVLKAFGNEIAKLPWSCCGEMAEILDRLIKS